MNNRICPFVYVYVDVLLAPTEYRCAQMKHHQFNVQRSKFG